MKSPAKESLERRSGKLVRRSELGRIVVSSDSVQEEKPTKETKKY